MCKSGMIRGTMDPSSYSIPKPPNITIDTGDRRIRRVHLNRSKIHPFQGGSPTPLAGMTYWATPRERTTYRK